MSQLAKKTDKEQATFSKRALVEHFEADRLLVSALLDSDKEYTVEEVEVLIEQWKGANIK